MSDPLGPARGIVLAVLAGAILWVLILVLFRIVAATSTLGELGRRAVEEGVIR